MLQRRHAGMQEKWSIRISTSAKWSRCCRMKANLDWKIICNFIKGDRIRKKQQGGFYDKNSSAYDKRIDLETDDFFAMPIFWAIYFSNYITPWIL